MDLAEPNSMKREVFSQMNFLLWFIVQLQLWCREPVWVFFVLYQCRILQASGEGAGYG